MATYKTAGGKELILSPFVLATTRIVLPKIRAMEGGAADAVAQTEGVLDILVEALRRANPEATREWLEENILTQELDALLIAVIAASGLAKREPAPGEAKSP